MALKQQSDERLFRDLSDELDEDILSIDYAISDVENELRKEGVDSNELSRWGAAIIQRLSKDRRLAWQVEAKKKIGVMQAKLDERTIAPALPRAELLTRIAAAQQDPRLQGSVAIAARNLGSEASEEELRQILEDLEALALLADGEEGDKR